MKKIYYLLTLIFALTIIITGCSNKENLRVKGEFDAGEQKMVYLYKLTTTNTIPLDSAKINDNGKYTLNARIDGPVFLQLKLDNQNFIYLIALPGEKIKVTAKYDDFRSTYFVEGSKESSTLRDFMKQYYFAIKQKEKLLEIYNAGLANNESTDDLKKKVIEGHKNIKDNIRKYAMGYILKNKCSLASLVAIYQELGPNDPILAPETDFVYYEKIDSCLSENYTNLDIVLAFNKSTTELRERNKLKNFNANKLTKGEVAPDIALPGPNGDTLLLSSLKGKYVLLDFWASWSKSCRMQNKLYAELFDKYKDEDFMIYQVSLDKSAGVWLKAIEEDNLKWIEVSDLKFWNSYVVNLYEIYSIPSNFLINPQGIIIEKNITGSDLKMKLSTIFKK